jgi:imidazolonepropionase-like amidohydrolase
VKFRVLLVRVLLVSVLVSAPQRARSEAELPAERWTIVQCGQVLLVAGQPARGETTLVVHERRIAEVLSGIVTPDAVMAGKSGDFELIDLREAFVMPGLIDAHVHLRHEYSADSRLRRVTEDEAATALRGSVYARTTLEAGFTSVRDLGGGSAVFALRDAIANGTIPGPRMLVAGRAITPTGGHGDLANGYREDLFDEPGAYQGVADGPYEARKAVRAQIKRGADVIKLTATGGVLSNTNSGTELQFKDDELAEIVSTAHMLGRKVAAHAHGAQGVNAALRAGVDSIEHGTFLDAESLKLFSSTGAWYVPTVIAGKTVEEHAKLPGFYPPAVAAKARLVGPQIQDALRRAQAGGVRIAFGTDAGVFPHGQNGREFQYMVEAGMSPMDALRSATVGAASLLGIDSEVGTLEVGKRADLIAMRRNPLIDVTELTRVIFVMRGGSIYKRE